MSYKYAGATPGPVIRSFIKLAHGVTYFGKFRCAQTAKCYLHDTNQNHLRVCEAAIL